MTNKMPVTGVQLYRVLKNLSLSKKQTNDDADAKFTLLKLVPQGF